MLTDNLNAPLLRILFVIQGERVTNRRQEDLGISAEKAGAATRLYTAWPKWVFTHDIRCDAPNGSRTDILVGRWMHNIPTVRQGLK